VFSRVFCPAFQARESERDGAFAEARVGFFFHRNGFHIRTWEPEAVPGRPGDIEISWHDTEPIFIEVKGPGCKGELLADQRKNGRNNLPKYINAEWRTIDPIERVAYAVGKALPKFATNRANLVVVVDDLFVSPLDLPTEHLRANIVKVIAEAQYRLIGGVLLFNPVSYDDFVEYRKFYVANAGADHPLPEQVHEGLTIGNLDPSGPRWRRK
jgi:hypothetical protein